MDWILRKGHTVYIDRKCLLSNDSKNKRKQFKWPGGKHGWIFDICWKQNRTIERSNGIILWQQLSSYSKNLQQWVKKLTSACLLKKRSIVWFCCYKAITLFKFFIELLYSCFALVDRSLLHINWQDRCSAQSQSVSFSPYAHTHTYSKWRYKRQFPNIIQLNRMWFIRTAVELETIHRYRKQYLQF